MDLSPKALRFVLEALEHYARYHDQRMQEKGLSEDELADLANDRQYLEAIKQDLQLGHEQPGKPRQTAHVKS
jgi:hypothetical protein